MTRFYKFSLLMLALLLMFNCSSDNNEQKEPEPEPEPLTVTDIDGNVYNTITLGNQTWMLENLKVTTFNDGTPITAYEFGMDWLNLDAPQALYQWANTDDLNNAVDFEMPADYYGAMYNHFAIESGKLAPEGWRIPTAEDFEELESFLVFSGFAGGIATALKSDSGWLPSSGNGTNAIGFNGLPNGYVSIGGTATASEIICSWGTSTLADGDFNSSLTRQWIQLFDENGLLYSDNSILLGVGIRCIKSN